MISEQWVTEIISRFPYFSNRTEDEKSALRQDLIEFAEKKSQNILSDILSEFKTTEFKKAPGMWWFYQRANAGMQGEGKPSWRECECGTLYVNKGSSCPSCGSYSFIMHVGDSIPTEAIEVTESCSLCTWYKDKQKGIYGPSCREYGTYESGKDQICKDCKCYDCCQIAYLINHNPTLYRERYGDIIDNQFIKMYTRLADKMGDNWNKAVDKRS